jgi:signal transduction histidine kinase
MRDEITHGELQALVGRLLASQEDERHSLARELHDDVCQRLARLEMDAYELERSMAADPAAKQRICGLREAIGGASAVIRAISQRLYPSIVEDLGLGPALRSLTDEFRRRQEIPTLYLEENVPDPIQPEIATLLYRITEEALRNVIRHAGETEVEVSLRGDAAALRLTVTDFGCGFDPAEAGSKLGLIAMEERARLAGASFRIESAPGAGALITVELPID